MSTNFYLRRIPTTEEINKAHRLLDECIAGGYDTWSLDEYLKKLQNEYHLGKRSCGWQFHWQLYDSEFEPSLESVKAFIQDKLDSGGWKLVDEYDKEFTLDQFINEEIGESMYCHYDKLNNRWYHNSDTYHKEHPNELKRCYFTPNTEFTSEDGLRWDSRDFR